MRGLALLVWFGLAGLASIALFNITFKVEQLQNELNGLNKQILKEQKAVHVLQAEWSYLSRPARIEALSQRLLPDLQPPTAHQVGNVETLTEAAAGGPAAASREARPAVVRGAQ